MPDWNLIARYISGEHLSPEEKKSVEHWISESEANAQTFTRMKQAMKPVNPPSDFNDTMQEDWEKIMATDSFKPQMQPAGRQQTFSIMKIAAGLLLVFLSGWALMKSNVLGDDSQLFTAVDSIQQIELPDGSTVWLNKNSSLLLHDGFGEHDRKVALTGEGYFNVTRDTNNTFTVYTADVQTRVLGTEFNIRNQKNGNVKVTVQEGKVGVSASGSEIKLIKGEVAIYWKERNQLSKSDSIADTNYLSWKTGIIRFNATPLIEACSILSRHYGVTIIINSDAQGREITSVIDNLTLDQALEIVTLTLDLQAEKRDNEVVLSDKP